MHALIEISSVQDEKTIKREIPLFNQLKRRIWLVMRNELDK